MKKIVLMVMMLTLSMVTQAMAGNSYYIEVTPVTTTYDQIISAGITEWQISKTVSHRGEPMGHSGTSLCQVIDLAKYEDIDGYFTFQMKSLTGVTSENPISGQTFTVLWRGSNIDNELAWTFSSGVTVIDEIDVVSGATQIVYDMNDISGVTPIRYMRFEFISGASLCGESNIIPVGTLHIR